MILKINGKIAAKTLVGLNNQTLVCVNCMFFENTPENMNHNFDCYGLLGDVIRTGLIEGLRVEKNVLDWFQKEQKRIEKEKQLTNIN